MKLFKSCVLKLDGNIELKRAFARACLIIEFSETDLLLEQIKRWGQGYIEKVGYDFIPKQILMETELYSETAQSEFVEFSLSYQRQEARGILANALYGNLNDTARNSDGTRVARGGLDFTPLFVEDPISDNKLACLAHYFVMHYYNAFQSQESINFTVIRGCQNKSEFENKIISSELNCDTVNLLIHQDPMEKYISPYCSLVDCANKHFGYGKFVCSATQEEILQMCCPEMCIGMLNIGTLDEVTVVIIQGVWRYSAYSGYQNTFRFHAEKDDRKHSIVVMDAAENDHLLAWTQLRDIRKAYLGFQFLKKQKYRSISTTKWGCGTFGGPSVPLKLAHQVIAAALSSINDLYFATYSNETYYSQCIRAQRLMQPKNIAELWKLAKSLDPAFHKELRQEAESLFAIDRHTCL